MHIAYVRLHAYALYCFKFDLDYIAGLFRYEMYLTQLVK